MAITKRTRFEVLRRDKHTCQYCGAQAPEVTLHIDHIVPVSLGGDDKPGNLVAACKDCNTGKASIAPDAPLIQGLSERAAAYALGMIDKMTRFRAAISEADAFIEEFEDAWGAWHLTGKPDSKIPLPPDYELSLFRWKQMGVPFRVLELAIPKAMSKRGLHGDYATFQYMAGIVWRMIDAQEVDYSVTEETAAVFTASEANEKEAEAHEAGWRSGWDYGYRRAEIDHMAVDFIRHHIDQTEMVAVDNEWGGGGKTLTGGVVRRAT